MTTQTTDPKPATASDDVDATDRNAVELLGRVSGDPQRRALPSGAEVVELRVVVTRIGGGHDTVPVQVGPAPATGTRPSSGQVGRRVLGRAERLRDGDRVAVTGSIRRRWWAAGGGRRSRIEVAATQIDQVE